MEAGTAGFPDDIGRATGPRGLSDLLDRVDRKAIAESLAAAYRETVPSYALMHDGLVDGPLRGVLSLSIETTLAAMRENRPITHEEAVAMAAACEDLMAIWGLSVKEA